MKLLLVLLLVSLSLSQHTFPYHKYLFFKLPCRPEYQKIALQGYGTQVSVAGAMMRSGALDAVDAFISIGLAILDNHQNYYPIIIGWYPKNVRDYNLVPLGQQYDACLSIYCANIYNNRCTFGIPDRSSFYSCVSACYDQIGRHPDFWNFHSEKFISW